MSKQLIVSVALAGALLLGTGCNRNYDDITSVSSRLDTSVEARIKEFDASTSVPQRRALKSKIVEMRQKQVVMAERVDIDSMPGGAKDSTTRAAADAKKADMVAKAKEALAQARKLSIELPAGTASTTSAPSAAAPATTPASAAPPNSGSPEPSAPK